jgi:hypothetical protein
MKRLICIAKELVRERREERSLKTFKIICNEENLKVSDSSSFLTFCDVNEVRKRKMKKMKKLL